MKIRGANYLDELFVERDNARLEFIKLEEDLIKDFENKYYRLKAKANKFLYLWFYIFFGYVFILLLLNKEFDHKVIKYTSIVVGIIIFICLIYPLYLIKNKNKHKLSWDKEEAKLLPLKKRTSKLNEECAKLSLAVICLSENYQELKQIKDLNELHQRWLILLSQYQDGINLLHHKKATAEDYINYYRKWLQENT